MGELKIGSKEYPLIFSRAALVFFSREIGVSMVDISDNLNEYLQGAHAFTMMHCALKVGAKKAGGKLDLDVDDLIIEFDNDETLLERFYKEVEKQSPDPEEGNEKAAKVKE